MSLIICTWYSFSFYEVSMDQLRHWRWNVIGVELMSGLKIKMQNSELLPSGEMNKLASLFGCKVGRLPTYLGLPWGVSYKSLVMSDAIEERLKGKLVSWKKQYLSQGERLMLYRVPSWVFQHISCPFPSPYIYKYRKGSNWKKKIVGNHLEEKNVHLVSWLIVCKDKKYGGLGISRLKVLSPTKQMVVEVCP